MSGSAGGNRIPREALQKTVDSYIKKVLNGFKGFKSAKISGSYNTTDKKDFGDIDLIVNIESDSDKKTIKQDLVKHLESLPEDLIVPFKSEKNKGKRSLNHGEIVTVLYPIEGVPGEYVQIDNIVSLSEEEGEFKKSVLDLPAEKQGLVLGLIKVVLLEEDPEKVFAKMGIKNIDPLGPDEEYEFHVDTSGLTLKKVKLDKSGDKIRTVESTDVWKTSNFDDVKKLLSNFNIDGSFEDIIKDIKNFKNPRSKDRVKGWFLKNIRVQAGEMGTPKAEKKQQAIDAVSALEGKYNALVMELITPIISGIKIPLIEAPQQTIAIFPGKFKPPHKDHLARIQAASQDADKVIVLVSPISSKDEPNQETITAEQSKAVFDLYKSKNLLPGNVEVLLSNEVPYKGNNDETLAHNSPVRVAYEIIDKRSGPNYIAVFGKEEDFKRFGKIPSNTRIENYNDAAGNLSATDLRTALKNGDDISSFLPNGVTPEEYKQALGLNKIQEEKTFKGLNRRKKLSDVAKHRKTNPSELRKEIKTESELSKVEETLTQVTEYQTQSSLNPEIWEEDKIKPDLADALIKIAKKFYKDLNIFYPLEDIILVGSSANYNWTKLSDVDLHLLIDFSQVKDPQLFKDYVDSKKNEFNDKYDLKYKNHPVEVYVQDVDEPNAAQGVYSLLRDEWVKIPKKEDIEVPDSEIDKKAEPLMNQIDDLIADNATTPEDVKDLKSKIRRFRKSGLEAEGEYSLENLAFKKLRYNGYLEKLSDLEKNINIKDFGLEDIKENDMSNVLKKPLVSLTKYISDNINVKPLPKVKFVYDDKENADNILGKTAHYDPNDRSITLYTLNRHPKDILRSFSHEMIHHNQNLEDRLNNINTTNTNEDGDLPEIEREAYEKGNMLFRTWEDSIKNSTLNEIIIKKPFDFSKILNAYKQDSFYKKYVTKNGYVLFHLLSDDLLKEIFSNPEDQQKAKDYIEILEKDAGSSYILFKDGRITKPTVGLGYYAEVIDGRWIKDRRRDSSEALLDSENNFKEVIKSDPDSMIKSQGDNVVVCKVNGQYVFFNYLTETVLGEFDNYNAIWGPQGYKNGQYVVKKDGKAGQATLKNGELTVNFDYEDIWDRGSTIYGYKDGYTYILDDNNKAILKVKGKFTSFHPEGNNKFIAYKSNNTDPQYTTYNSESGLITSEGEILIPFSPGYLYKKGDYYFRYPINKSSFSIFDENGKLLSKYDVDFPSEANMRNFNQLEKILKVIPIEDLHKLFSPLEWSQIIAYSKDPEKTIELTQAGDIIAKFNDDVLKDCLKRAPGAKKVNLLKIFKKYNNSPMLEKYYKKYNIDEIIIKRPPGLITYKVERAVDPEKYPGMFSGITSYKGTVLKDSSIGDFCCSGTYKSIGPNILVTIKPEIFEKIKDELPQQLVSGPPKGMLNRFSQNISGDYFTRLTKEYFTIEDPKNLLKDMDNLNEIKINKPGSLDFDTGKVYRVTAIMDTEVFKADYLLELIDLGPYYTFQPYENQPFIILVPKNQVEQDTFLPVIGAISKRGLDQLKDLYNNGKTIYNKPL